MASEESEAKALVHKFCSALMRNDLEEGLDLFSEDPTLLWGPYSFQGKEEIKHWASELREMFPVLFIKEKSIGLQGGQVRHEFLIESVTKDGQHAWLPCVGTYDFSEGRIKSLDIRLLHGWLAVKREDLERVRPPP